MISTTRVTSEETLPFLNSKFHRFKFIHPASEASNPRDEATQKETQRSQTLQQHQGLKWSCQAHSSASKNKPMRSYESPGHALSEKNIKGAMLNLIESCVRCWMLNLRNKSEPLQVSKRQWWACSISCDNQNFASRSMRTTDVSFIVQHLCHLFHRLHISRAEPWLMFSVYIVTLASVMETSPFAALQARETDWRCLWCLIGFHDWIVRMILSAWFW